MLTIRKIRPRDNTQVAAVIKTVMTSYRCVGNGFSIEDPEVNDMYSAYDNERSIFYVVADDDQKIFGCAGIAPLEGGNPGTCELKKMYFYPDVRGQGLGKQMMEVCLTAARILGYKHCYLETVEHMERANHLYAKYGFKKLCSQEGGTGHSGCDTFYKLEL